jgi:hypothetical protein
LDFNSVSSLNGSQAWINTEIKRFSRKKQKAYNKVKASKKTKDWDHYISIKKKCQIECRKPYNNYVSTMLNNDIKSNPKRLWSFVAPLSKGGTTIAVVWKRPTFSTTSLHQFSLRRIQLMYQLWVHHHSLTSNKYKYTRLE